MSEKMRMAVIMLCLALAATLIWYFQRDSEPPPTEQNIPVSQNSTTAVAPPAAPAPTEVTEADTIEDPPSEDEIIPIATEMTVSGTVLDDQTPIDGIVIVGFTADGQSEKTTTQGGGQFRLSGFRPGSDIEYRVEGDYVLSHMMVTVIVTADGVESPDSDPNSGIMLYVTPGARISGTVVAADGVPIYIGRFYAIGRHAQDPLAVSALDQQGAFRLSPLRPGKYDLRLSHSTSIDPINDSTLTTIAVETGQIIEGLHLFDDKSQEPGLTINGLVTDDVGSPIPNADIMSSPAQGGSTVRSNASDEDGRFMIQRLEGVEHIGMFSAKGHVPEGKVRMLASTTDLVVVLRRTATVSGTIVDAATGKPVEEYQLAISNRKTINPPENALYKDFHDEDGAYSAENLYPDREVSIWVRAAGYGETQFPLNLLRTAEHRTGVRIPLESENIVRGMVVDPAGTPVANAKVYRGKANQEWETDSNRRSILTDLQGRFELNGYARGEHILSASKTNYVMASEKFTVNSSPTEVTIVLGAGAMVDILVTFDGQPTTGTVRAGDYIANTGEIIEADIQKTTDLDGLLEVRGLAAGTAQFEVEVLGMRATQLVRLIDGVRTELVFDFTALDGSLDGYLMANETDAVIGRLQLLMESGAGLVGDTTTTDDAGFYRFENLPSGTFKIIATQSDTNKSKTVQGELKAYEEKRLDILFNTGTQLVCVVENPPADAEITCLLFPENVEIPMDVTFGDIIEVFTQVVAQAELQGGIATLTNIDPGVYTLVVAALGPGDDSSNPLLVGTVIYTITVEDTPEQQLQLSF